MMVAYKINNQARFSKVIFLKVDKKLEIAEELCAYKALNDIIKPYTLDHARKDPVITYNPDTMEAMITNIVPNSSYVTCLKNTGDYIYCINTLGETFWIRYEIALLLLKFNRINNFRFSCKTGKMTEDIVIDDTELKISTELFNRSLLNSMRIDNILDVTLTPKGPRGSMNLVIPIDENKALDYLGRLAGDNLDISLRESLNYTSNLVESIIKGLAGAEYSRYLQPLNFCEILSLSDNKTDEKCETDEAVELSTSAEDNSKDEAVETIDTPDKSDNNIQTDELVTTDTIEEAENTQEKETETPVEPSENPDNTVEEPVEPEEQQKIHNENPEIKLYKTYLGMLSLIREFDIITVPYNIFKYVKFEMLKTLESSGNYSVVLVSLKLGGNNQIIALKYFRDNEWKSDGTLAKAMMLYNSAHTDNTYTDVINMAGDYGKWRHKMF